MKKKLISMFCFILLAASIALLPKAAYANSLYKLKGSLGTVTFSADLDSDGVDEKVTAKGIYNRFYDSYSGTYYDSDLKSIKISIKDNGKTVTTTLTADESYYCLGAKIYLVKLDNKHRYLNIVMYSDNDYVPYNKMFKYVKSTGKIKSVGSFVRKESCISSCKISSVSGDRVVFKYVAQPSTTGLISFKLTYLLKDGAFKLKSATTTAKSTLGETDFDSYGSYFKNSKYKTCKKLTFYTTAGGSTKAYTVDKNKLVTLKKIKLYKGHIYGQFAYGTKTGWKKLTISNVYNWEVDDPSTSGWFYGVYYRLAG